MVSGYGNCVKTRVHCKPMSLVAQKIGVYLNLNGVKPAVAAHPVEQLPDQSAVNRWLSSSQVNAVEPYPAAAYFVKDIEKFADVEISR